MRSNGTGDVVRLMNGMISRLYRILEGAVNAEVVDNGYTQSYVVPLTGHRYLFGDLMITTVTINSGKRSSKTQDDIINYHHHDVSVCTNFAGPSVCFISITKLEDYKLQCASEREET